MGSIDKACISGFLCRLCSEMHRTVIHIYGDQGQRLCLVEKINGYLPITISPTDPLPKTICTTCLRRVEQHYALLMKLTQMREKRKLQLQRLTQGLPYISSPECSDDESSDRENRTQESHVQKVTASQPVNEASSIENITNTVDEPVASGSSSGNITSNSTSATESADPLHSAIRSSNITN